MPRLNPDDLTSDWISWFQSHGFGVHSFTLAEQIAKFVTDNEPLTVIRDLTPEQKSDARDIFEGKNPDRKACIHCAGLHHAVAGVPEHRQPCRRVKHIKWHTDGSILEAEYWPNGEWEFDVVFPGEVYDDIENEEDGE